MTKLHGTAVLAALGVVLSLNTSDARAEGSSRTEKKFGIMAGLLGTPIPSLYGFMAGYNVTEWLRVRAGIGFLNLSGSTGTTTASADFNVKATTIGGDATLSVPGWSFSPVAIVGFSNVTMTITGTGDLSALGGLTASGGAVYFGGGVDWQTHYGLVVGADYKLMATSGSSGLPGLHLGWFF